ncbi:probable Pre-mRNA-splicing factor RDS3 [Saccharomycodes ludwigii]|uniref:Probable Pre-mRNA-splicing factor RDS3 n=1 Tax=Saccharomycodes ludwigii TaxID=36035 RepID=A0A376B380_9ASCO|nr:hypothetical protein SCDLUD_000521 [Saccharomycodes ludwigii]KAH3902925.1 hypothetical protein SCDLUD_000521 [Saccharomycodes ludwigii]SSD59148.1 probable Pre-mRNA-splicing factor RDS3 [Saccharomycodes ludwigii]
MSRHQFDLVMCLNEPGKHIGKVCDKCDGRCPICDSMVNPTIKVRICDQCSNNTTKETCIICGAKNLAKNTAYYCYQCYILEKNKDGCPKVINVGNNKIERHFNQA